MTRRQETVAQAAKSIAQLRQDLATLYKDGLGKENVDQRVLDDLLEEHVLFVIKTYLRLKTAQALGIEQLFMQAEDDSEE